MKKITQEKLDKRIELHRLCLEGLEGGIKLGLSYYDLRGLCFEGANLEGVRLWGTIGDGTYIKNIHIPNEYRIAYTHDRIQIGCKNHSIDDWTNFKDERIIEMDGKKALRFWREYKEYILDTVKNNPAKTFNSLK